MVDRNQMPRGFILEGPEPQPLPAAATWRLCLGCPTPWEVGRREACDGGGRSLERDSSCCPQPLRVLEGWVGNRTQEYQIHSWLAMLS